MARSSNETTWLVSDKKGIRRFQCDTSDTVYTNSVVGWAGGRVLPYFPGLPYLGIVQGIPETISDVQYAEVITGGCVLENVAVTSATSTKEGCPVYATDDSTFTLAAQGSIEPVGRVIRVRSSGYADVELYPSIFIQDMLAEATDTNISKTWIYEQLPQLAASYFYAGRRETIHVEYSVISGAVSLDTHFWRAPHACVVQSVYVNPTVLLTGTSGSLMIDKCASGEAPGSGTDILAAGYNLKTGTASTPTVAALHATAANYTLAAGDWLGVDLTLDTADAGYGSVTIVVEYSGSVPNSDWVIEGTNSANTGVVFTTDGEGITLTTGQTENDWIGVAYNANSDSFLGQAIAPDKEPVMVIKCKTGSAVEDSAFLIGFKLTNTLTYTTDNDQAYIKFDAGASDVYWTAVSSTAGVDTLTVSDTAPEVDTEYTFVILIDSSRVPHFYMSDSATKRMTYIGKGSAITATASLRPFIQVHTQDDAADSTAERSLTINEVTISRSYT